MDPCRLLRQRSIKGRRATFLASELLHLPDKPAGVETVRVDPCRLVRQVKQFMG
jgi:hypothetical protein